jgi:hypothetical protein
MKSNDITIYAMKNTRKNSKNVYKTYRMFYGEKSDGLKQTFTNNDFVDIQEWVLKVREAYPIFQFCVYVDNVCLHSFIQGYMSDYQALRGIQLFMKLLNK